jgi:alkylhydroperoxidase/carboxymuconolactone decarboxylase family protein YurZ
MSPAKTTAKPSADTPVCDRLRAADEWNPEWQPSYDLDPAWTERFFSMAMSSMQGGILEPKTIEFLAIAVDASCTHMYGPGVRRHIRKALQVGATKEEIAAVLQAVSVLGFHTMSIGAPMLIEEAARFEREKSAAAD